MSNMIVDLTTGETTTVPLTAEEITAREADAALEALRPYRVPKDTIIDRMLDSELAAFETRIANASARVRLQWQNHQYVSSETTLFTALSAAFTNAWGAARATAILARP